MSCVGATCPVRQISAKYCTSLMVQADSHLLDTICWFTAGTKKEALSRLF
tara:strand:- start:387 stop:536 length:150 start_codon:yes stop_codon:yes gene_type:complete